jgi:ABC-type oligopeptide transport system substrate-binding subunit
MAYTDAANFAQKYAGKFQTWEVPTLATSFIVFNVEKGPFTNKQLRVAAAHAIDHEAIKQAVFYGRGETARGLCARQSLVCDRGQSLARVRPGEGQVDFTEGKSHRDRGHPAVPEFLPLPATDL